MTRSELSLLFSRTHCAENSVLSAYLNVDQSRPENLNRKFESHLKKLASQIQRSVSGNGERQKFDSALRHIREFVSAYHPAGKALVLFYDHSDGFFVHDDLEFPVQDQLHWGRELLLEPLASALDQLEGYCVVLVDRTKVRLFVASLGKIEEVAHDERDPRKIRHLRTVDPIRIVRWTDNQVLLNLRNVAKRVEELAKARKLRRLILVGAPRVTAELRTLLPAHLAQCVIGETVASLETTPEELLELTRPIAAEYELDTELEKVSGVVTSAVKKGKAVVGLDRTLKAVNSGRVWELIYARGYLSPGFECPKCAALFCSRPTRCPYCSSRILPVANVVERAVEHALRKQANVEVVTGKASEELKKAGGIGAFLRTRTGSLER